MIKAVVFDVDNTLVDFMKMKNAAVDTAIDAMIDAGLDLTPRQARKKIDIIYKEKGIEYQQVLDDFLESVLGYNRWQTGRKGPERFRAQVLGQK